MGKEQIVNWYSINYDIGWLKVDIAKAKDSGIYSNCYIRGANTIALRHDELVTLAVF